MNAQCTPGLWDVGFGYVVEFPGVKFFAVGVRNEDQWQPVALLSNAEDATDQDRANAALIVASRDLLAALQPFVGHNSSDEFITIRVRTEDVARARAAIARATGSTQ